MFRDNSDSRQHSTLISALAIAVIAAVVGITAISGGAAAVEVENTTVEVDNDTASIYVEAEFADGIDDANATADVVIENPDGTEFESGTISANASETIVEEYELNDSDPTGNYSVVVEADDGVVNSSDVGTFDVLGGGGGSGDGTEGFGTWNGIPIWVLVLGGAALVLVGYHKREET